jgi:hypothetical protein
MALAGALASCGLVVGGFSNQTLRPLVAGLLGPDAAPYTQGRCCYDLRRLKLKGLIVKIEHTNTYVHTPDGQRFAVFYTKVHNRLLRPLLAADRPPAPLPVRLRPGLPTAGWLPRMPDSLEALDGFLLHVAKPRVVQRDGIHFQGPALPRAHPGRLCRRAHHRPLRPSRHLRDLECSRFSGHRFRLPVG